MLVAAHQEVVAHREEDAHVRLAPRGGRGASRNAPGLRRVEGEELLELIHDHHGRDVPAPPASEKGEGTLRVVEAHQEPERLGVSREMGREGLSELLERRVSRGAHDHGPAGRLRRGDAGPDEGRLARAGRADHAQQPLVPEPVPDPPHLDLTTEEPSRVRLGEGPQAGVGALLLLAVGGSPPGQRPVEHRLEREGEVVRRVEALVGVLVQAAADHPVENRGRRAEHGAQRRRVVVQHRRDRVRGGGAANARRPHSASYRIAPRAKRSARPSGPARAPAPARGIPPCPSGGPVSCPCRRVAAVRPRQAGDPEVEDLDPSVRGEEEIVGLEVAVDDRARARPRARGTPRRELDRGSQGHRPALEALPEALALEELEHEVGAPAGGADVEDGQDVRVGEGGDGPRLVLEGAQTVGRGLPVVSTTLIATSRPRRGSWARYTSAIPPAPSSPPTS